MPLLTKLIEEKCAPEDIAHILGRHPVAIRRLLPKGYKPLKRMQVPYGLTTRTVPIRAKLASILIEMSEKGLTREQIGEITGLNKRQSYQAERRPYNFDWSLSQIERTLSWKGATFSDMYGDSHQI